MTIGATTINKTAAVKKNAVKQFLEQTLAKKSLTQQLKETSAPAPSTIENAQKTEMSFDMADHESNTLNPARGGGGSLPANANRYQ